MLPNLTSEFLVVLRTECNGTNSALGEIGVIKCLDDFFRFSKSEKSAFTLGTEELQWHEPEFVEAFVEDHLFDKNGLPAITSSEDEYWAVLANPGDSRLGYELEIFESIEGIMEANRTVLDNIATNYSIERWDVVRNLPGFMVLSIKGVKC